MVVLAYINKMTGRIPHLAWLAHEIHEVLRDLKAEMKAVYIQSKRNEVADVLSCQRDLCNWRENRHCFKWIKSRWWQHSVNCFVDKSNATMTCFFSRQ